MKIIKIIQEGILYLAVLTTFIISGCSEKSEESTPSSHSSSSIAEKSTRIIDLNKVGSISGKVRLMGDAPKREALSMGGNPECKIFHPGPVLDESVVAKDGNLKNVFIYIKEGLEEYSFPIPTNSVKIDQVKCLYVPHVSGAQVGQKVLLVNSDPTLHNVHSYSNQNESWNLGMPFEGMEIERKFSKPEVMITMKCDLHPWMLGYIGILPHPYFAISNDTGEFFIDKLPQGEYIIEAWHEKLGTQTQKIVIEAGQNKEIEFSFEFKKGE